MPLQDFNTTTNSDNWKFFQGSYPQGHAMSQNRSTPVIPSNQRGPGGAFNALMVDRINIEVSGYATTANARGRLWTVGGTALARSASQSIGAVSASTINIPLQNFDLESSVILEGDTTYRWGVYTAGTAFVVQKVINSSFNIYSDTNIEAGGDWSTGNFLLSAGSTLPGADSSFAGSFRYFLISTPPSISSSSSSSSSISISWSPPSNDGGKSVSAYRVDYKPSFSSTWISDGDTSSTSTTIFGLSSSTTYNVRVAARNEVSDLLGTTSEFASTSVTTQQGFTPPPPPIPPPPTQTTVPSLNTLTLSAANTAIANASLSSSPNPVTTGATAENNNLVISNSQSPTAGSVVNVGSTVSFNYYSYTPPSQKVSVWNGTSWVVSTPRVWNGTSWVEPAVIRIWNGTSWVNPI